MQRAAVTTGCTGAQLNAGCQPSAARCPPAHAMVPCSSGGSSARCAACCTRRFRRHSSESSSTASCKRQAKRGANRGWAKCWLESGVKRQALLQSGCAGPVPTHPKKTCNKIPYNSRVHVRPPAGPHPDNAVPSVPPIVWHYSTSGATHTHAQHLLVVDGDALGHHHLAGLQEALAVGGRGRLLRQRAQRLGHPRQPVLRCHLRQAAGGEWGGWGRSRQWAAQR